MPRSHFVSADPLSRPDVPGAVAADPTVADRVARLADLIADGRISFPPDLPAPDRDLLVSVVRARLTDRMVGHIARAIAADLAAARGRQGG